MKLISDPRFYGLSKRNQELLSAAVTESKVQVSQLEQLVKSSERER